MNALSTARLLALAVPAALMAGALGSQYIGGLYPCEMCMWQRWPHYTAIALALLAFVLPSRARPLTLLAAIAILISGGIGLFHAGVEYGWWQGLTRCSTVGGSSNVLADIMSAPLVRCDEVQWSLFGISLAGFNAIISLLAGAAILRLCQKHRH